jgi:paraquat-inducible protein B
LQRADTAITEIEGLFSKRSTTRNRVNDTLQELAAAARSIRIWSDYLERNPEALIWGKGGYRR